jgi:hypothetical protein
MAAPPLKADYLLALVSLEDGEEPGEDDEEPVSERFPKLVAITTQRPLQPIK